MARPTTLATGSNSGRRQSRSDVRRGATLLELLLVLAILVAVAAVAAPSLNRTLENHRLTSAAEQVQSHCAAARAAALRTGQTHALLVEPGGGGYLIEPWTDVDVLLGDQAAPALMGLGANPPHAAAGDPTIGRQRQLPEGVLFAEAEFAGEQRTAEALAQASVAGGPGSATGGVMPILFFPDGTASTARIVLANQQGRYVAVEVRGLTGMARVGQVFADDPLAR
jgi:type II secretory pathway pseudopilin PulG